MISELVARPPYSEPLSPAAWRQLALVRIVLALTAIAIDLGILAVLRGNDGVDTGVLDRFAMINLPLICLVVALSLGMLRRERFRRTWLLAASAVVEAATLIVWSQTTGSLTSYFILAGALMVFFYRVYTTWAVAVTMTAALIVLHGSVIALEAVGVLEPSPLFVGEPGTAYTVATYQILAATSIGWIYALTFLSSNAIVNKLRAKDRALAELRREAALATRGLGSGRLSGLLVAGEYALHELLGRGGMGEIYRAHRVSHDDDVALKILHAHLSGEGELLERFAREAELARRIPGEHVAEVLAIGRDDERDLHYIAMELLHGEDLAAHLRRVGRPALPALAELAGRLALAVDAAHDAGVVHRDLKPHNVFLADDGVPGAGPRVVLLDFGLSKAVGTTTGSLTATDALLGTVGYMAPEQALGPTNAGPASDRYAMAAIVYRALTGKPPNDAADVVSALERLVSARPSPPSQLVPGLSPQVDAVMAIGLARDPDARFARAADLAAALAAAARGTLDPGLIARAETLDPSFTADPTLPALSRRS